MSRGSVKNDARWRQVRAQVRERDNYRCRQCGSAGRVEVDHVVPVAAGGEPYDLNNLQVLCRPCHHAKTRAENGMGPSVGHQAAWKQRMRKWQTSTG